MTDRTTEEAKREAFKLGNEFAPYHPDASHVEPGSRDGWNACYRAAREADREAMRMALEALIQATVMCAEGTSTRRDVDAAIKALEQRVGES